MLWKISSVQPDTTYAVPGCRFPYQETPWNVSHSKLSCPWRKSNSQGFICTQSQGILFWSIHGGLMNCKEDVFFSAAANRHQEYSLKFSLLIRWRDNFAELFPEWFLAHPLTLYEDAVGCDCSMQNKVGHSLRSILHSHVRHTHLWTVRGLLVWNKAYDVAMAANKKYRRSVKHQ